MTSESVVYEAMEEITLLIERSPSLKKIKQPKGFQGSDIRVARAVIHLEQRRKLVALLFYNSFGFFC
jgi:hypothetical protein